MFGTRPCYYCDRGGSDNTAELKQHLEERLLQTRAHFNREMTRLESRYGTTSATFLEQIQKLREECGEEQARAHAEYQKAIRICSERAEKAEAEMLAQHQANTQALDKLGKEIGRVSPSIKGYIDHLFKENGLYKLVIEGVSKNVTANLLPALQANLVPPEIVGEVARRQQQGFQQTLQHTEQNVQDLTTWVENPLSQDDPPPPPLQSTEVPAQSTEGPAQSGESSPHPVEPVETAEQAAHRIEKERKATRQRELRVILTGLETSIDDMWAKYKVWTGKATATAVNFDGETKIKIRDIQVRLKETLIDIHSFTQSPNKDYESYTVDYTAGPPTESEAAPAGEGSTAYLTPLSEEGTGDPISSLPEHDLEVKVRALQDKVFHLIKDARNLYEDSHSSVRVYVRVKIKPPPQNNSPLRVVQEKYKVIICPNVTACSRPITPKSYCFYGAYDAQWTNAELYLGKSLEGATNKPQTPRELRELRADADKVLGMFGTFNQLRDGYRVVLFGYGLSGSGKSHTLLGSKPRQGSTEKTDRFGVLHLAIAQTEGLEEAQFRRAISRHRRHSQLSIVLCRNASAKYSTYTHSKRDRSHID